MYYSEWPNSLLILFALQDFHDPIALQRTSPMELWLCKISKKSNLAFHEMFEVPKEVFRGKYRTSYHLENCKNTLQHHCICTSPHSPFKILEAQKIHLALKFLLKQYWQLQTN